MMYQSKDLAPFSAAGTFRATAILLLALAVAGCGEVDESDGEVVGGVALPTDSALDLYCEDAGIADEPCILDDPKNPYSITPVNDLTKFDLSADAPSAKARFYLWATAQALSPRGENQYYTAVALHEMWVDSGSELAREHALRAYRSVLDNYFFSVTFFEADFLPPPDIFFPKPVRQLVGANLFAPQAPLTLMFDTPTNALELFGQWGYTYDDQNTLDFTPNL